MSETEKSRIFYKERAKRQVYRSAIIVYPIGEFAPAKFSIGAVIKKGKNHENKKENKMEKVYPDLYHDPAGIRIPDHQQLSSALWHGDRL